MLTDDTEQTRQRRKRDDSSRDEIEPPDPMTRNSDVNRFAHEDWNRKNGQGLEQSCQQRRADTPPVLAQVRDERLSNTRLATGVGLNLANHSHKCTRPPSVVNRSTVLHPMHDESVGDLCAARASSQQQREEHSRLRAIEDARRDHPAGA